MRAIAEDSLPAVGEASPVPHERAAVVALARPPIEAAQASVDESAAPRVPARRASSHRRPWWMLALGALALAGLALAWRYTPLAQYATAARASAIARGAAEYPWTPVLLILAYPVGSVLMFPRPLITLFAVVAFGPVLGFGLAMAGVFTSAMATYLVGRRLPKKTVDRLMSPRMRDVEAVIRKRGLRATLAISIVPVAPFIVVGAAAGAIRVRLRDYIGGVLLGHVPGTLANCIFGHQLKSALAGVRPDPWLIAGAAVLLVVTGLLVRRWFAREMRAVHEDRG